MDKSEKIQIHKMTGRHLGLTPGKDGFYFASPGKKITMNDHNIILAKVALDLMVLYEGKINHQRLTEKYEI